MADVTTNKFSNFGDDTGPSGSVGKSPFKGEVPFFSTDQAAIDILQSLTAAEKAGCKEYIKIWQVDPTSGKPAFPEDKNKDRPKRPLTLQFIEPPQFGVSVDTKFRERPKVSLSKVSIKHDLTKGRYSLHSVHMSVVIHHPDALPSAPIPNQDGDDFGSLIVPGNVHAIEYGWRGPSYVKNDLFNGNGLSGDANTSKSKSIVPAIKRVYFTVANYNFKIEVDGQIKLEITGYESGMLNLRQFFIGSTPKKIEPSLPSNDPYKYAVPQKDLMVDFYKSPDGIKLKKDLQVGLNNIPKTSGKIKFIELCNFFAPTINAAFKESGYSKIINLKIGKFNTRVGTTSPKFFSKNYNNNSNIGDFEIPFESIKQVFENNLKAGKQITVQNFFTPFINLINDQKTWSNKNQSKRSDGKTDNQTLPDIFTKIITNGETIGFYIVDAKREFSKFTKEDFDNSPLDPNSLPSEIKKVLINKSVPYITFMHANSFIKEANFSVIQDEKIKAHLINEYMGKDKRKQGNKKPDVDFKNVSIDPKILLYSGAIQGDITMIGNFCFDVLGLFWLDFSVARWSGPFFIRTLTDDLERGNFITKVGVISAGTDPLGTQGLKKKGQAPSLAPGATNAAGLLNQLK